MQGGRLMIDGQPYQFWYSDGFARSTGWISYSDGSKSYCVGNGKLAVGTVTIGGVEYTFDCEGYLELYSIEGTSSITVDQMVAYYNSKGKSYPSSVYSSKGASTIREFCQIYYDEATAEGINAEVAFCQAMKETGWLQFGGTVKVSQCNFAGIGATDSGGTPATFADVATGARAQIQHLKAYANTDDLNKTLVDPRFQYVTRGVAPYVEWLGIQENPSSKGWASAKNYGYDIVDLIMECKQY